MKRCFEELEDVNPCSPSFGQKVLSEIECPPDLSCEDIEQPGTGECVGESKLPIYIGIGDIYCTSEVEFIEGICLEIGVTTTRPVTTTFPFTTTTRPVTTTSTTVPPTTTSTTTTVVPGIGNSDLVISTFETDN